MAQYQVKPFLGGAHFMHLLDGVVVEDEGTYAGTVVTDGTGSYVEVYFDADDQKYAPPDNWADHIVRDLALPAVAAA